MINHRGSFASIMDIHASVRRGPKVRLDAFFATARGSEPDFDRRAANRFNKRHVVGMEFAVSLTRAYSSLA